MANECFDWDSLDEDQRKMLVDALHEAHHEGMEQIEALGNAIVSLAYGMKTLSKRARKAQKKGKHELALVRQEAQLEALYRVALATVGMTPETLKDAEKFADIAAHLQADPEFNQEPPEQEENNT